MLCQASCLTWQPAGKTPFRTHNTVGILAPTQPRRFGAPGTGTLPPQALLDGTSDEALLTLLWQTPITMLRTEVDPPPNTRHLAVLEGSRVSQNQPDRAPWS